MKRILLTCAEKEALRNIALDCSYYPDGMSEARFSACVSELERLGLVHAAWASGHEVVAVELTDFGRTYLQENPHLSNPVDWAKVGAIAAVIGAVVAFIALFVACQTLISK